MSSIKGIPDPDFKNTYTFNNHKEPKVFNDLLDNFLRVGYYDSNILFYQLRLKHNPIVDIRLIYNNYNNPEMVFVENTDMMHSSSGFNLLEFLRFFDNLPKPTKETLLNNILKTDHGNILFSYQISNNTITFI